MTKEQKIEAAANLQLCVCLQDNGICICENLYVKGAKFGYELAVEEFRKKTAELNGDAFHDTKKLADQEKKITELEQQLKDAEKVIEKLHKRLIEAQHLTLEEIELKGIAETYLAKRGER